MTDLANAGLSGTSDMGPMLSNVIGEPVEVVDVARPGAGMSNSTLLVDAVIAGEPRALVIKRLSSVSVVYGFDPTREFRVLQALHSTGVRVPRPLGVGPADDPYIVMERAPGISAPDPQGAGYAASGWVREAAPDRQRKLWNGFIDALADMHRRADSATLSFTAHGDGTIADTVAYWRSALEAALRGRPAPLQFAALDWMAVRADALPSTKPTLCMADARLQNAIFDGDEVSALIDFEIACLGNPAMDIAYALHIHDCFVRIGGGVPLPGWPSREETWARWSEQTGRAVSHHRFWSLLAGIVIAVTATRGLDIAISSGRAPAEALDDEEALNIYATFLRPILES